MNNRRGFLIVMFVLLAAGMVFGLIRVLDLARYRHWHTANSSTRPEKAPYNGGFEWATCIDKRNGFSIQYPTPVFDPSLGCAVFSLRDSTYPMETSVHIMIFDNAEKLSPVAWLHSHKEDILVPASEILMTKKLQLGQQVWFSFTDNVIPPGYPPNIQIYWAAVYDEEIALVGLSNLSLQDYDSTIERMLSTFQIDP